MMAGGVTTASSRPAVEPRTVAATTASAPSASAPSDAARGAHVSATSWTSPSRIRQARTLGSPVAGIRLVVAERDEQVQRVRVEREPDVGRRRDAPACGCASGRSPRRPRRRRRSRSSGGAGRRGRSRSGSGEAALLRGRPRSGGPAPPSAAGRVADDQAARLVRVLGPGVRDDRRADRRRAATADAGPGWRRGHHQLTPPSSASSISSRSRRERAGREVLPAAVGEQRHDRARGPSRCASRAAATSTAPHDGPAKIPSRNTRSRSAAIASRVRDEVLRVDERRARRSPGRSPRRASAGPGPARRGAARPRRPGRPACARAGSARRPSASRTCPGPATNTSISGQSARISGPVVS